MCDLLTIDGGITNTRICLVRRGEITDMLKLRVGVRTNLDGSDYLKREVKQGIASILERNGLSFGDVGAIVASGMITSENGLLEVPHIPAPAGARELADAMKQAFLPEICPIPFLFVPGIRTAGARPLDTDVIRGEETECIGLMELAGFHSGLLLLPGSHSKAISLREGWIEGFSTFLSGEMFSALRENTILKASVSLEGTEPVEEYLRLGYEYCEREGVNKSLFKVRVLARFLHAAADRVYSFFSGVLLHDEIRSLLRRSCGSIYIGGQSSLKRMMKMLLEAYSDRPLTVIGDEMCEKAPSAGAAVIFRERS